MRVYVPSTLPALAAAARDGLPAPVRGHAVTPALREWYRESDTEELEYAATAEAARSSLRLLAADPGAPPRRVVIAVDVPDVAVRPDAAAGRAAVVVGSPVPWAHVASLLVDDGDADDDVRAGAAAVGAADAGDDEAGSTVDGVDDHDLLWYAAQEVDDLS